MWLMLSFVLASDCCAVGFRECLDGQTQPSDLFGCFLESWVMKLEIPSAVCLFFSFILVVIVCLNSSFLFEWELNRGFSDFL